MLVTCSIVSRAVVCVVNPVRSPVQSVCIVCCIPQASCIMQHYFRRFLGQPPLPESVSPCFRRIRSCPFLHRIDLARRSSPGSWRFAYPSGSSQYRCHSCSAIAWLTLVDFVVLGCCDRCRRSIRCRFKFWVVAVVQVRPRLSKSKL
jgi:hypothetical protein